MSLAIEARDLSKTFRRTRRPPGLRAALRSLVRPVHEDVLAVSNISLLVERGETLAFIGPNGAGKSTTIKMLTGILHPTSGTARVLGFVPWTNRRKLVARLGCVFGQRSQLWHHLPVAESFDLVARVFGVPRAQARRRQAELVELFEIGDLLDAPVRKLSLGERMRCELAAALIHGPEALFLDEPTIGLDVLGRARIRELLVRLNEHERVTVFLTSHDSGDIEQVCRRVVLIDHGRLVLDTSVESLRRDHLREKVVEAVLDGSGFDIDIPGVVRQPSASHVLSLRVDLAIASIDRVLSEIVRRGTVRDITISDPALERVIASLYRGSP